MIGQNVKNVGDETIGEIRDLLVDMKSGEIHAVVISSGGLLVNADTLSAVPVSALRFDVIAKAFKARTDHPSRLRAGKTCELTRETDFDLQQIAIVGGW
ncbi:MAG: PRC-barrel domain-containing protein [Luteolibacter sp.]|uniref:PRC-barrel domain-containing protein n=1 Tax=Luteolibacter sp. TaxID=1962973 RepID=UPI003267D00F